MSLSADTAAALRGLPGVDALTGRAELADAVTRHGRPHVIAVARSALDAQRAALVAGRIASPPSPAALAAAVAKQLETARPGIGRVFNLTGTVLHTNLGRAPLADRAVDALLAAAGAADVEYERAAGARGQRDRPVEALICELTGADAALVVNNNAAAVVLMLNALASGDPQREVIISRGELIEIGDSFRIPDIMARAGARLVEVGTTNRTHAHDFEQAVGAETALLMRVWPSNYEIRGFTERVAEAELAAIAHAHDLPLAVDLGSGSLVDMTAYGLPAEPTPSDSLAVGADLVMFSGDKLLGGPQAGIIVGNAGWIGALKRSPLKRALRCDKLTLAALEATLVLYRDPDRLAETLPTLRLLTRDVATIRALAERLAPAVAERLAACGARVLPAACASQIGSGALPVDTLDSFALRLAPPAGCPRPGRWLAGLKAALAGLETPVIGRITDDALWLDLRCLEDETGFIANLTGLDAGAIYAE